MEPPPLTDEQRRQKPKLEALWKFAAPDQLDQGNSLSDGRASTIFGNFNGQSLYCMFDQLCQMLEVNGWHVARDAYFHFAEMKGLSTISIDAEIAEWMTRNKGLIPREQQTELGVIEALFNELDAKFSTAYFSERLKLITTIRVNHPLSPCLDLLDSDLTRLLQDGFDVTRITQANQLKTSHYDTVRQETAQWAKAEYAVCNPVRVDKVDELVAAGTGNFGTIDQQEIMKHTIVRLYKTQDYYMMATWSTAHPERRLREALIEYLNVRDAGKLQILNQILKGGSSAELVRRVVDDLEVFEGVPFYKPIFDAALANGEEVFFPPWRNAHYPKERMPDREMIPDLEKAPDWQQGYGSHHLRMPYKIPMDYLEELESQTAQQQQLVQPAAAPQTPQPHAVAAAAAATPAVPTPATPARQAPEEELTEADLVPKQDDPSAEPSHWAELMSEIEGHTAPAVPPSDLEFNPEASDDIHAEEKEGWLCFEEHREHPNLVTVVSRPGRAQSEPLCQGCSERITRSRKAVWSSVSNFAPSASSEQQDSRPKFMEEGFLEVIKEDGILKKGKSWVRRWVRATDTGIHYYVDNTEASLKKAAGSRMFNDKTQALHLKGEQLVAHSDLAQLYPQDKIQDASYMYIGFKLHDAHRPPENFWLRASREMNVGAKWVKFFKSALNRYKKYDDSQDPNPAKWKARVAGLLEQLELAKRTAEACVAESLRAKQQRLQMEELHERAESDRSWAQEQAASAERRAAALRDEIFKVELECQGLRKELDCTRSDTKVLLEKAEQMRQCTAENIEQTTAAKEASAHALRQLEEELEEAEKERNEAQQDMMGIYAKWRRCEERTPNTSVQRADSRTGLPYVARNSGSPRL